VLIAAGWYFIMGLLHDVFVIKNHKGSYDRELLRLLMDGHVLMLSGVLLGVCFLMLRNNVQYAPLITLIVGIGMLAYCCMIFPFLKSFVTMFISLMVVIIGMKLQFA
jgi:glucose-6-phosphate-specific signal transduction histidine kinase